MKNKSIIVAFSLVAVFAASCNKATNNVIPTADNANTVENVDVQSTAMSKNSGVPFKGSLSYSINMSLNLPCNCGALATVGDFEGTGTVTHMGLLKAKNKTCVAPIIISGNYVGNQVTVQCASFVAANGDEIYCNIPSYNLMFTANGTATGTLEAEFTGGTGRFANATGSFTGTMTVPLSNPGLAVLSNINGTIKY